MTSTLSGTFDDSFGTEEIFGDSEGFSDDGVGGGGVTGGAEFAQAPSSPIIKMTSKGK